VQQVPYMLVLGDREAEQGKVAVRQRRGGDQGVTSVEEFIETVNAQVRSKSTAE